MEILEYLNSMTEKVEEYNKIKPLAIEETEKNAAIKKKIEEEFQSKLTIEEEKYKKIVDALYAGRDKQIQEELLDEKYYKQSRKILDEKLSFQKELLKKCHIDHALMCELLKSSTGKQWKPVKLTGNYFWGNSIGPGYYYAYGVILFSEEHKYFSSNEIYYDGKAFDANDKNLLASPYGSVAPCNPEYYDKALNYNWLKKYLLSKNFTISSTEYIPGREELTQTERDLIDGAIEPYIKNPNAFKANTGVNPQIFTSNTPDNSTQSQSGCEDEQ